MNFEFRKICAIILNWRVKIDFEIFSWMNLLWLLASSFFITVTYSSPRYYY